MTKTQRYLILPARGLQATADVAGKETKSFLRSLDTAKGAKAFSGKLRATLSAGAAATAGAKKKKKSKAKSGAKASFKVVQSLHEDGVKLVKATPEMAAAIRYEQPGVRVVPERFYRPARFVAQLRAAPGDTHKIKKAAKASASSAARKLVVEVVRGDNDKPVRGASVVAFTNADAGEGVDGETKANGKVTLRLTGSQKHYEQVYVQHELAGLWSFFAKKVPTSGTLRVVLQGLELDSRDSLRHFHTIGKDGSGKGVRVGIIDSGVALAHPDLKVAGGLGCVPDESPSKYGPTDSHGTHVAGIIAGNGKAPKGVRGIAPAAKIYSYRVFGHTESSGSSFALVKAIEQGIADKCDLLNMSLGFDPEDGLPEVDEAVQEAIRKAYKNGVVVIAAAGNDGRRPVNYPAFDDLVIAVSAVGREGTFPAGSSEAGEVIPPEGADKKDFVAAFSNIGTELDVAGAGVGVVSTVPPKHYAPMSGTSMACPAVTGVLARLLAATPKVLKAKRDSARAEAIKKLLFKRARTLGFKLRLEGKGLPR